MNISSNYFYLQCISSTKWNNSYVRHNYNKLEQKNIVNFDHDEKSTKTNFSKISSRVYSFVQNKFFDRHLMFVGHKTEIMGSISEVTPGLQMQQI